MAMTKYKKYPEYKDSGVEWLGEIPSHWVTPYLRRMINVTSGDGVAALNILKEADRTNSVPVIGGNGVMGFSNKINSLNVIAIGRVGSLCGNVHFIHYKSWVSDNALRISLWTDFEEYYLVYLLKSAKLNDLASKTAQPLITGEQIKSLKVVIPNILEQRNIINFLDHETAKIDCLITKQEKLIELLKEKRQAVIRHAVSKGLNPNVPMRESGVEWLGEVPEHWKVGRLKNVLTMRNGRDYKNVEVESGGYPVYGSGGVFKRSSDYLYNGISLLFGRKGTIDKPLLVEGKFWTVDTMFYSEIYSEHDPTYIYYQSLGFPFDKLSTHTALPSMTQEDLLQLELAIPPKHEQIEILEFLNKNTLKIDDLLAKAQSAIQLMQERRTALISAAVTGKIDVRDWA